MDKPIKRGKDSTLPSVIEDTKSVRKFEDYLAPGAKRTSMVQLKQDGSAVRIVSVLFKQMAEVVGANTSPAAIVQISEEFVEELKLYPVEDLVLFLRKAAKGTYGPLYNKLSLPTLMEYWRKYDEERSEYLRRQNQQKTEEHIKGSGTFLSPYTRESADSPERPVHSLEWVLRNLYGYTDQQIAKARENGLK